MSTPLTEASPGRGPLVPGPAGRVLPVPPPPGPAASFLAAVVERDDDRLAAAVAPDVWLRSLQPRSTIETNDRASLVATYRTWFGQATHLRVLHTDCSEITGRWFISYRLELRPPWEPEVPHVIEQLGAAGVRDGWVRRLDLICTGFHPVVGCS